MHICEILTFFGVWVGLRERRGEGVWEIQWESALFERAHPDSAFCLKGKFLPDWVIASAQGWDETGPFILPFPCHNSEDKVGTLGTSSP